MQKKYKKTKKKPELFELIDSRMRSFITDLNCIEEMFNVVLPELEKKDNERKKIINNFFKKKKKIIKERAINEIIELMDNFKKLFRAKKMFKQNSIVMMVSRYDDFFAEVIRLIYKKNPDRLRSTDKSLSYEEILSLGSVGKTLDRIINKEIDCLLYKNHYDQLKYLEKEFKINIVSNTNCVKKFIEITERRNLFVHSGGKVSDHYLSVCKKYKVSLGKKIKEGVIIGVDKEYFENAYNCLFEIGVVSGQLLLRKIFPKKLSFFDESLNETGYDLLKISQWQLANIIFDFALKMPPSSDLNYKIFIVNKCITLKHLKEKKPMNELLNSIDWSSSSPEFLLAVQVLKGNYNEAELIMRRMRGDRPNENDFRVWPLFKEFRTTNNFKRAFKKIYKKDYKPKITKELRGKQGTPHF